MSVAIVTVGVACMIVWTKLLLLEPLLISPPYAAVMVCTPTASSDVVKVVDDSSGNPVGVSCAAPIEVAPSLNVMVPVGTELVPFTVAVKVTESPNAADGLEEMMTVVFAAWFTV